MPRNSVTVLAAGDHFIQPSLIANALRQASDRPVTIRQIMLPWPDVPFGPVGEVDEASGTEAELIDALEGVQVCLTQMAPLTERILDASPDLRLFAVSRGGPVNANIEAATRHGVGVTFAPGRNATATAEHTVAILLAALRRVPQVHADLAAGTWRGDYYRYDQVGLELHGRTVGLLGYGAIGSRVGHILRAFGATVLVHDPYVDPGTLTDDATAVGLDELISRSQVLSLHARVTDETRNIINTARIAALPAGAVIVNCARGALVDYDAVCDALDAGHLFGAAFDVFPTEPIPAGSRLLSTPGIVMTPHLAGASRETAHNAARIITADVARYLAGQPLRYCTNPDALNPQLATCSEPDQGRAH